MTGLRGLHLTVCFVLAASLGGAAWAQQPDPYTYEPWPAALPPASPIELKQPEPEANIPASVREDVIVDPAVLDSIDQNAVGAKGASSVVDAAAPPLPLLDQPAVPTQATPAEPQTAPQTVPQADVQTPSAATSTQQPVLMRADEIRQDRELGIVVARGHVELAQEGRYLLADTVSYNQKANTVTASGDVKILEPSGDVIFADFVELTDDLKNGAIKGIRVLLADNARIASNSAKRYDGRYTEMSKAVYSACDVCKDDPERAPLWQIKARKVIHDQEDKQVEYQDARLEMYGMPVAYSPYFSHPDPTVKRRSGFLIPSFGTRAGAGTFLRTPYFWAISEDKDATLDPILSTNDYLIMSGQYRQRFNSGIFSLEGSTLTKNDDYNRNGMKKSNNRWHVFTNGAFSLNDTWRTGFDINRSSDRTYLSTYRFWGDPENALKSRAYVEGFRGRNYFQAEALDYQNLRSGDHSPEASAIPNIDYIGFGNADRLGGRWDVTANTRYYRQHTVSTSQRASTTVGYRLPLLADIGYLTTLRTSLRGDVYNTDFSKNTLLSGHAAEDGITGRVVPRFSADWRFPFSRVGKSGSQTIEPVAGFFSSPNLKPSEKIDNTDSLIVELDDTNLLSENRSPGLDRIDVGTRVAYGLKYTSFWNTGGRIDAFAGQSYRFTHNRELEAETGLSQGASDIVGHVNYSPTNYLTGGYRFQISPTDLRFNRNELTLGVGPSAFRASTSYIYSREGTTFGLGNVEQGTFTLSSRIDQYWSVYGYTQRDLTTNGGTLSTGGSLTYEDECFIFKTNAVRRFTGTEMSLPSDDFTFQLTFKTLGSVDLAQ